MWSDHQASYPPPPAVHPLSRLTQMGHQLSTQSLQSHVGPPKSIPKPITTEIQSYI